MSILTNSVLAIFAGGFLVLCAVVHGLMEAAGLRRIRLHDLRHTHVTLSRRAGESWDSIARRVGHTSPGFTMSRYNHVLPQEEYEAAERLGRSGVGFDLSMQYLSENARERLNLAQGRLGI